MDSETLYDLAVHSPVVQLVVTFLALAGMLIVALTTFGLLMRLADVVARALRGRL